MCYPYRGMAGPEQIRWGDALRIQQPRSPDAATTRIHAALGSQQPPAPTNPLNGATTTPRRRLDWVGLPPRRGPSLIPVPSSRKNPKPPPSPGPSRNLADGGRQLLTSQRRRGSVRPLERIGDGGERRSPGSKKARGRSKKIETNGKREETV